MLKAAKNITGRKTSIPLAENHRPLYSGDCLKIKSGSLLRDESDLLG